MNSFTISLETASKFHDQKTGSFSLQKNIGSLYNNSRKKTLRGSKITSSFNFGLCRFLSDEKHQAGEIEKIA